MARTKNTRRGKKKLPADENVGEPGQVLDGKNGEDHQQDKTNPSELDDLIDQAERLMISSDFEKAKQLCEHVLKIHDTHPRALETLALGELELGELQSARKVSPAIQWNIITSL
jgi:hypothetical protein